MVPAAGPARRAGAATGCRGELIGCAVRSEAMEAMLRGHVGILLGMHVGEPQSQKRNGTMTVLVPLLTLCKRCLCLGMQHLASVRVRKENAAMFPGSGLSMQPEKIALLANSEVEREFGFVVFTAACGPGQGKRTSPSSTVPSPSSSLRSCPGPGSRAGSHHLVFISTSQLPFHGAGSSCYGDREAKVLVGRNDSQSSTAVRESSRQ